MRSGIVQSVHAFAADPTRGMSVLFLLAVFVGGAMTLFALKGEQIKSELDMHLKSKDSLLIAGNIVLVIAALSVLLGTFYPLIYDLMGLGTLSVGAPYFNSMFVPLAFIVFILMGAGPLISWKQSKPGQWQPIICAFVISALIAGLIIWLTQVTFELSLLLGFWGASYIILTICYYIFLHIKQHKAFKRQQIGMLIAHFGVAISVIGATCVSHYEEQALLRMGPGQGKPLAGYIFVYDSTVNVTETAFTAIQANIQVLDENEQLLTTLTPQRQTFKTNGMEMSQASIDRNLMRDLYVSKGQQLSDTEYLIRISYKPFACFIWLGALWMMFGALLNILPMPIRQQQKQTSAVPTPIQERTA